MRSVQYGNMQHSQKKHDKELKHALREINEGGKNNCTLCRFVLMFAFATLFIVLLFAYYSRTQTEVAKVPEIPEPVKGLPYDPVGDERKLLELGKALHPELSIKQYSVTNTPPLSTPVKPK